MVKKVTSLQHPVVKHLVKLRQNRDYRYEYQTLVLEGNKIIEEVCQKSPAKTLLAYDETQIPKGVCADEILIVNEAIMHKISGMQTPEGLIAEIAMPQSASLKGLKSIVAFDGITDPGNEGTLIRTALALGWQGVFIVDNCCDPFNEKTLRAARGATFRLPMAMGTWNDLKKLTEDNKLMPFVADIEGESVEKVSIPNGVLLVLSSEAHGVSREAAQICKKVTIPMPGEMESLNVSIAGGILMYVIRNRC